VHRRLTASGIKSRALVEESRYRIACQMLANADSDASDIAALLDYADTSTFARALRRWSGITPS
jgi:AraC-like DNA-binding protein